MFCDLAGFTALSQRLDPEEIRDVLRVYQQTCAQVVARFDGHVAQYLGDGVLVYFGYPRAHEDDAQRSVRAALAIQTELRGLNAERTAAGADPILARIGIHTGPVVITQLGEDDGRQETLALGDTINIAARLEGMAEPGGVLVSDATLQLVGDLFVARDLGTPALKGVTEQIRVHAVDRVARASPLMAEALSRAPLSGREVEIERLVALWDVVVTGRGQVVTLSGEPGIGKSRLLRALYERLAELPHLTIGLDCTPYAAGNAFKPILDTLERDLGLEDDDTPEEKSSAFERALSPFGSEFCAEVVPFVASLLGLPESERYPLEHMSPDLQRQKSLQALTALITTLSEQQPILLVCEDVQWADPSTLELLGRLIDETPAAPIFLVLSYRDEFTPTWQLARSYVTPIALTRLTRDDTRAIVEGIAGDGRALPDELIEQIAERADGVPLYAEELAKAVVDSELLIERDGRLELKGRVAELSIPSTLQGSLMARLDRLSVAKRVAQLGATLGRTFPYELIEAVSDFSESELRQGLGELVTAEILFQRGTPPDASYTFRHLLLQDTAYQSQLKSRQGELHARTTRALEEQFPQRVAAEPEVVARHCAEGGMTAEAVDYYKRAGELALSRHANQESVDYYARSLDLFETLPENPEQPDEPERRIQEISLRLAQCVPLAGLRGYDDEALVASAGRCESLCAELPDGPQKIPALLGLMLNFSNRGLLQHCRGYADRLLAIAEPLGIAPLCMSAHLMRASAALTSTAPATEACAGYEKAYQFAIETDSPPPGSALEIEARSAIQSLHSCGLVLAGFPIAGMAMAEAGIERARSLGHPRTIGSVFGNSGATFYFAGNVARVGELGRDLLEVLRGRGFGNLETAGLTLDAWSRAKLGDSAGRDDLDAALAFARNAGVVGGLPQYYVMAAEVAAEDGDAATAFSYVDECQKLYERTGEHGYAGAAAFARAQAHVARGAPDDACTEIEAALACWSKRVFRWMDLRAAALFAEIALARGQRVGEARTLLEQKYAPFTEGFELPLLERARDLASRLG